MRASSAIVGLFVAIASLAAVASAGAADPQYALKVDPESRPVAERALPLLGRLATNETYQSMGFGSLDEVNRAILGTSLPVHYYWVKELKRPRSADPEAMLGSEDEVVYPIEVGPETRTSVTVKKKDGFWRVAAIGSATDAHAIESVRKRLAAEKGKELTAYFLLRVPQLYLLFVGYYDAQGKLMLASVWQNDDFAIKAGTELPAEDVLRILRPAAQGYSGRALKSGPARQSH